MPAKSSSKKSAKGVTQKTEATKKTSSFPILAVLVIGALALLLLKSDKFVPTPKLNEETAQLVSVGKSTGSGGTALRTYDASSYNLYISAFLAKPKAGEVYTARLTGAPETVESFDLGEMAQSGDLYTLNFSGDTSYTAYTGLEITLFNEATGEHTVVLEASFN